MWSTINIFRIAISLTAFSTTITTKAQQFPLKDTYIGYAFFNSFNWNTFDDPTHGQTNYVSKDQAIGMNLSWANNNSFGMQADHWSVVDNNARGRNSVRITSNAAYGDSITVLDLQHMPEGCSTWPAFWTCSKQGPWPNGGEIDIIEGVNNQQTNLATLHTSPQCAMPANETMTGQPVSNDCDANVNHNEGCGVSFIQSNSYGSGFNAAQGGWYVMKRTAADGVWVWFWSRNDPMVPDVVRSGGDGIQPDLSWGSPSARFVPDQCDMPSHFDDHQIIFDLTFCGDWAGSTFATSGCSAQSCSDFVNNTPEAFTNAYWEVNSLRVYAS